jgi:peroxiredoxin
MRILLFALLLSAVVAATAQKPGAGLTSLLDKPQAPDFQLPDVDGNIHRLSDYRGRVVIVNFWATWCPPCRAEMPSMQRAWEKLQQEEIMMLAVNVGEDEDTIFQFTANYPVEFPLLMDLDSKIIGEWPVRGLPTTFVVDPQGRLVYRAIGARQWDETELLEQVKALRK